MCLDNLKEYMDNIQNEFLNIDIDKLINEMKGYKNSRNAIINDKIKKINYFFNRIAIVIFTITTIVITFKSNFDIGIIFAYSLSSLIGVYSLATLTCTLVKYYIVKNNNYIRELDIIINKTSIDIEHARTKKGKLFDKRRDDVIKFNNQREKVMELENIINEIKLDYANMIFDNMLLENQYEGKYLNKVRTKKI